MAMEEKVAMKWRYDFDNESRWSKRILPRKYYCKYCYGRRDVYYLHDDFISAKKEFHIMMVCSNCTYHLAPILVSITDTEMQALSDTPLKTHEWGSITENGITRHNVTKASVMPYGFLSGKPQYPSINILNRDLYKAIEELGVVPNGIITRLKKGQANEEQLIDLYQRARQFREEIDALAFLK
jgi:hypothetical protein